MEPDGGFPDASQFAAPMLVAGPMSCTVSDVGAPAPAESVPPYFAKECRSGPVFSDTSDARPALFTESPASGTVSQDGVLPTTAASLSRISF